MVLLAVQASRYNSRMWEGCLICDQGSKCKLDLAGSMQFRIVRAVSGSYTIENDSGLFLSRTSNLELELTETRSDSFYFTLQK
jgi:hypothetical protein